MLAGLAIALPLTLAGVFLASGAAKFRAPDDLQSWAAVGVPEFLRREWLRRLHPWAEVVLGAAIALLGGVLGLLAACAAVVVMAAYTWLVVRTVSEKVDATCACFGARKRVTRVTVGRNVWLTVLAVATAAVSWTTPLVGGPLREAVGSAGWLIGLAVAAVTTALILWPDSAAEPIPAAPAGDFAADSDDLDYIRTRTPAVPVTLANGSLVNLRSLAQVKPILLLSVSGTCGSCLPVVEKAGAWRELLPELDIRLLLAASPEESTLADVNEPQSLHDPAGYARESLNLLSTPSAVLLGADGLLAGGPVVGTDDVEAFIGDVYESLHGVRPPVESTPSNQTA